MKSLIAIVLVYSQMFSQISKYNEINNRAVANKWIDHKVDPIDQKNSSINPFKVQNSKSRKVVNQTTLDNGFLLIEEIEQKFDGSNLANDNKDTYTYDGNNNEQEYYHEKWVDNNWVYDLKVSSTYDENNNLVWQGFWEYISGPLLEYPWYDYLNDTYKYDQNNNVVEWVRQKSENSEWLNLFKYKYKYDANNNVVEKLWLNWSDPEWINHQRETYIYDENSNERQQLIQNWDGSSWVHDRAKESKYKENNLIECLYMNHEDVWVNNRKETYTYNEKNNVIEYLRQKWQGDIWVDDLKREYTYTFYSEGNYTEIMYLLFPRDSGWVYNQKIIYYYTNYDLFEAISHYPIFENGELFWGWTDRHLNLHDVNHNLLEDKYQKYDYDQSEWQTHELKSYKYMAMTGLDLDMGLVITYDLSNNYPNPFNPSTRINYSIPEQSSVSLRIFDVLGREVATLLNKEQPQGNYSIEFDASKLTSGIYFYTIQAGDFVETKKMVLMK